MILVDVNILLYAEDRLSRINERAREWWDAKLSGSEPVCFPWQVISAFIRISTNQRIFAHPLSLGSAIEKVHSWLEQPCTRIIQATNQHWPIFQEMLTHGQAVGNLVPDAHLAALAVEHGCILFSTDTDFAKFPRIKWRNPLRLADR